MWLCYTKSRRHKSRHNEVARLMQYPLTMTSLHLHTLCKQLLGLVGTRGLLLLNLTEELSKFAISSPPCSASLT